MDSLGKSQCQNPRATRIFGFSIHFHFLSSRTTNDAFLSANGLPREYHGQGMQLKVQTLLKLSPHILVRDIERMYCIIYFMTLWSQGFVTDLLIHLVILLLKYLHNTFFPKPEELVSCHVERMLTPNTCHRLAPSLKKIISVT